MQSRGTAEMLALEKTYDSLHRIEGIAYVQPHEGLGVNYKYNQKGQREFATEAGGDYWKYAYDTQGQLESAVKRMGNHKVIPGYQFTYAYDDIGNRTSAERDGSTAREQQYYSGANASGTAGANALNQYGSRSVPRILGVLGNANANATVTANSEVAEQAGAYFQALLDYSGEASPDAARKESIQLVGTYAGQGAGGTDAVAEVSAEAYLPPNPESYTYDLDGNLLTDSRWVYSWDGENRLVAIEPSAGAVALGLPNRKQVFIYDSEGRRFRKETFDWDSVGGDWETSPAATSIYLYDGWNLLSERIYDGSSTLQDSRYYTWGSDLSGTLQGAGGVGGLLAATTDTGSYYPAYDGNGNVMGYIDSVTGSSVAQFAYGPFGQALRATGSAVDELSFRFSTKYADSETGLLYYGYRYYDAVTGRWLNRDPIGEQGGLNLYGFVGNDGVNRWDWLGLAVGYIGASKKEKAALQTMEIEAQSFIKKFMKDLQSEYSVSNIFGNKLKGKLTSSEVSSVLPDFIAYHNDQYVKADAVMIRLVVGNYLIVVCPQNITDWSRLTFKCGSGVDAFVSPADRSRIYICPDFLRDLVAGKVKRTEQVGTILNEMSHVAIKAIDDSSYSTSRSITEWPIVSDWWGRMGDLSDTKDILNEVLRSMYSKHGISYSNQIP